MRLLVVRPGHGGRRQKRPSIAGHSDMISGPPQTHFSLSSNPQRPCLGRANFIDDGSNQKTVHFALQRPFDRQSSSCRKSGEMRRVTRHVDKGFNLQLISSSELGPQSKLYEVDSAETERSLRVRHTQLSRVLWTAHTRARQTSWSPGDVRPIRDQAWKQEMSV